MGSAVMLDVWNPTVIQLGGGDDGKAPVVAGWKNAPAGSVIRDPYTYKECRMWGIRLDDCLVFDFDSAIPDEVQPLVEALKESTVWVETPRGIHLYVLAKRTDETKSFHWVDGDCHGDIKYGRGAYVVEAGSIRPEGGVYVLRGDGWLRKLSHSKEAQELLRWTRAHSYVIGSCGTSLRRFNVRDMLRVDF